MLHRETLLSAGAGVSGLDLMNRSRTVSIAAVAGGVPRAAAPSGAELIREKIDRSNVVLGFDAFCQ